MAGVLNSRVLLQWSRGNERLMLEWSLLDLVIFKKYRILEFYILSLRAV